MAPPDYVISDISMPGMTGIELAIVLRREIPTCKILLFSGHIDAAKLIEEARRSGHTFNLVEKPIHPTKLVAAIREL
jgi:DNA-binding NarL/FixJ family response regulator